MLLEKCNSYKIIITYLMFFFFFNFAWIEGESFEQWKLVQSQAVLVRVQTARTQCCSTIGRDSRKLCLYLAIDAVQRTALASLMRQNTTLSSFLRFLFNVYPSSFPRKVSKSVTEFLAGQVLVLIFLRNNRSTCRKFAYDQVCYHFRRKIRTKHTFKSLIYSIKSRN